MSSLSIQSHGSELAVQPSEHDFVRDCLKSPFLPQFIPDADVSSSQHPDGALSWVAGARHDFICTQSEREWLLTTPAEQRCVSDVVVASGYILEFLRQKNHKYSLHGTAVANEGLGIGLIGGISGIGKTSTALSLAKRGWKLLADEKFLIEDGNVVGGVRELSPNRKWQPHLEEPISSCTEMTRTRLQALVIPLVTDGKPHVAIYKESKRLWVLYEEASRDVRLVNGLYDNYAKPFPSLDTQALAEQRLKDMQSLAKNLAILLIRGSADSIADTVNMMVGTESEEEMTLALKDTMPVELLD